MPAPVVIKEEPCASDRVEASIVESTVESPVVKTLDNSIADDDELRKLRKINFKRKITGKEKRLRQNRKLFRMLTPRNAIAALNELGASVVSESKVKPNGGLFEAEIIINNVRYLGQGPSKMQAKNAASEKALRDLVVTKMQQVKNLDAQSNSEDQSMDDSNRNDDEDLKADDDVPMLQLASFALHKLFSEWEADGFEIPQFKSTPTIEPVSQGVTPGISEATPTVPKQPKPSKIKNELPGNSQTMHPVMLLSVMRPCTTYYDCGSQGVTPNITHTVGCTVDGENYIGCGRSKKDARKQVATDILSKLFSWAPST
ncbi:unnamed protein product [Diamesa serratosioi]